MVPDYIKDEAAGNQAALDEICDPDGFADTIRNAGTHIIALALFSQESVVSETDQQQLQAIAEGTDERTIECGTTPIPEDSAAGAYLSATDAGQLSRLFAGVGARIQGGTDGGELRKNTDGTIEIPVDKALAGFSLIFEWKEEGAVTLAAPGGGTFDPIKGSGNIPGVGVESSHGDGLYTTTVTADPVTINGVAADPTSAGSWTLHAGPETVESVDLLLLLGHDPGDHRTRGPHTGRSEHRGDQAAKEGRGRQTRVVCPRVLPLTTTVDGKSAPATEVGDSGTFTVPVDLSTSGGRTAVTVVATAKATTAQYGLELGPITSTAKLKTQLPVGFPSHRTRCSRTRPVQL